MLLSRCSVLLHLLLIPIGSISPMDKKRVTMIIVSTLLRWMYFLRRWYCFFLRQGGRTYWKSTVFGNCIREGLFIYQQGRCNVGCLQETDTTKGRGWMEKTTIYTGRSWRIERGMGKRTTTEFYAIISRHYLPETSKQNSMKLVRKPNFYQCYVLKSRSVFLDTRLSYGKLSFSSFQAPSTCNETLSNCYTSHVICWTLGSQGQRND